MHRFRYGTADKSFVIYLGNANNGLAYNTLIQSQPVTLYTSHGLLVRVGNTDITEFNINKIDLFTNINANGKYIYNLSPPLHQYVVITKGYIDGVVTKCHVGLIPILSRYVEKKTGNTITASSQQCSSYAAFKAFRFGNTEWATDGEMSNFWINIRCLEALRVWKLVLTSR